MKFTKMQGCGNDYVYVNGFTEKLSPQEKPDTKQSEDGLSDQIVQIPYCRGEGILDRKSYETYGTGIFVWRK